MNIIDPDMTAKLPSAKTITVDEESAGQRLDNFLIKHLKGVPKTHIYRIIRSGEVRVNKGRVDAQTRILEGDLVRIPPVRVSMGEELGETPEPKDTTPAKEFPILLEDEWMLAINKPSGVAVHGGSGVSFGVIEQLRSSRPLAKLLELVHRLDKETSGILLVAKKRSSLDLTLQLLISPGDGLAHAPAQARRQPLQPFSFSVPALVQPGEPLMQVLPSRKAGYACARQPSCRLSCRQQAL